MQSTILITFLLAAIIAITFTAAEGNNRPINICNQVCSEEENIIWATNRRVCFVFRNQCFFNKLNCVRQQLGEPNLMRLSRRRCQRMCRTDCPRDLNRVCAEHRGVRRTFNNACVLEAEICATGRTWLIRRRGQCSRKNVF